MLSRHAPGLAPADRISPRVPLAIAAGWLHDHLARHYGGGWFRSASFDPPSGRIVVHATEEAPASRWALAHDHTWLGHPVRLASTLGREAGR